MEFSRTLSRIRREKGYSQQDFAKKIGVGLSAVRGYEAGGQSPSLDVLRSIARTLGVSADELLFDENERNNRPAPFPDPVLRSQFERLSRLPDSERSAIRSLLEKILSNQRLIPAMENAEASWREEMASVMAEFRRRGDLHSAEEIDQIVNEAVSAVRNAD
ncbi:MAG: helix-turn-helix domain-containing protein [Desulfococcaceae bacterium]